ncbi:MAG: peptidoglycan-binding protein, partial [Fibrobacteraceae bacterium]|nr:peptidoglycan-binding protein [Fibrobacteraceae bacterium]
YQIHSPIVYTLDELKEDSSWFSIVSGEKTEPLIHIPETEIVVGIGKNTSQKVKKGDLVEIWDAKKISIPSRAGNSFSEQALLRLAGYAKITAIGDTLSRAIIVQSFREIYIRQAKARLKRDFKPINVNGYKSEKEASFEEMAQVSYAMDPTLVIGAYSYVLIDKGIQEGFKPGNAVAIWEKDKSDASIPPRLLGRGVITGADEDNASVLIRELYSNSRRVDLGHSVSVTHRANIVK